MQILLIMLIVVLLAFSVLLLALAKQSPREKQTEDKEQEEYIRDYAETVRQTGGSMKKLEHWKVIAIYLIIYDMIAVNFSYFMALLVRFDFRYSSIPTDYFDAWRSFAPIYTIIILAVFGCLHLYNSVWRFASFHELIKITVATVITGVLSKMKKVAVEDLLGRDTIKVNMEKTPNDLIHIGKPIEMDVQEFFKQLEVLAAYGYANSEKIRDIVAAIVPTYHSADSDLKLHKKVYEELMSEAAVAAEK